MSNQYEKPQRITAELKVVETHHILSNPETRTLCKECIENIQNLPSIMVSVKVLDEHPRAMCDRCGAITSDTYSKFFS